MVRSGKEPLWAGPPRLASALSRPILKIRMGERVTLVGGCIALTLAAACGGTANVSGKVEAVRFGDLAEAPVPKVRFDRDHRAACGEEEVGPISELVRFPYLQHVQTDAALLMWTAVSPDPYQVRVARPDGSPVGELRSSLQADASPADAHQHVARLTGLEPGSMHCYSLHAPDGTMLTPPTGFRTAPEAGSGAPVRFVAFGDSGHGGADQRAVFEHVQGVSFDVLLVTGDVAYGSGTRGELERNFFQIYEPMLVSIPSFPVLGNHDDYTDAGGPFREGFALPENGAPDGREYWYSFDWGDVHFVALDSERMGEVQAAWLEADLAGNELPWTIVYTHRSAYSSGSHGSDLTFRRVFGAILMEHRVPLVLSGHDHHYERSKPIGDTTYVVTGGGGRGTRAPDGASFTEFALDVLPFVHVTVEGEDLFLHAIDATGQEFDYVHIRLPGAG